MENFDVSVILPIKSSKANGFTDYFEKAITSLKNQTKKINELIIVHTDETSLVEILLATSALRTSVEVVPAVASASFDVLPRTETVALTRTASGTTVVVPVALTVM